MHLTTLAAVSWCAQSEQCAMYCLPYLTFTSKKKKNIYMTHWFQNLTFLSWMILSKPLITFSPIASQHGLRKGCLEGHDLTIWATTGWIAISFRINIHVTLNFITFGDALSYHLAPSSGQNVNLSHTLGNNQLPAKLEWLAYLAYLHEGPTVLIEAS